MVYIETFSWNAFVVKKLILGLILEWYSKYQYKNKKNKKKNGFKVLISKNNGFKVSISKIIDMIPIQLQRLIT